MKPTSKVIIGLACAIAVYFFFKFTIQDRDNVTEEHPAYLYQPPKYTPETKQDTPTWKTYLSDQAKENLKEFDKTSAFVAAEDFVKDKLMSPSSAEFVPPFNDGVTQINDTTWSVTGRVDSQNECGAMLRKSFKCSFTFDPVKQQAHCIDISIIE